MSATQIHPTAVIDPQAELASDVEIGPYAVIEGPVRIGRGTRVWPHAYLAAPLEIGENCQVHVGAVLGHFHQALREPQAGGVRIGDRTIIREYAQVHRASKAGGWTTIGSDALLMATAHVAHDCHVGNHVILANGVLVAGHVTIEDQAILSGHVVVHQFVRVGTLVMVGGLSRVIQSVPPYMLVKGDSVVWGLNRVGIQRAGIPEPARRKIQEAYRLLYRSGLNIPHALERIQAMAGITPEVERMVRFIQDSPRGICRHHVRAAGEPDLDAQGGDVV